jgi:hypothetical protein
MLLMALTVFTIGVRNKKPLDNSWPLIYWLLVLTFTYWCDEETFNPSFILAGFATGMLLRFEFMNAFFVGFVKVAEAVGWGYVMYRGFQYIQS